MQGGPGEVNALLEDEVIYECSANYGGGASVTIFKVTEQGFPRHEAVCIFVEFERVESATKACV